MQSLCCKLVRNGGLEMTGNLRMCSLCLVTKMQDSIVTRLSDERWVFD
jgi:hypothetical protein